MTSTLKMGKVDQELNIKMIDEGGESDWPCLTGAQKILKNHQAYFEGICKTIRLLFLNFRLSLPYLKDWLYFKNIFGF